MSSYSLRKVETPQGEIQILQNNGMDTQCPNKTRLPDMRQALIGENVEFKGFVQQGCDSMCPLFNLHKDGNTLSIMCSNPARQITISAKLSVVK